MKKLLVTLATILFVAQLSAQEEVTKKGWKLSGLLPAVTFDSDLGFQYGAVVDISDYGDGTRFPGYNHHLYFEVSRFTKGSGINRFYYDSDRLIPGILLFFDLSYLSDQAYDFYGFNGYDAVYNADWVDDSKVDEGYESRVYYKYDRKMFRMKLDLQGRLSGENLRWATGITLLNFKIGNVDIEKLNKGKDQEDILPDIDGLFQKYKNWRIIPEEEQNGGFVPTIKAGVVYDTRDNRSNPMKGIWEEAVLEGAPEFLGAESSLLKLSLTHRQYFTIVPKNLSLAYRLNYQTTIAGHTPFYYQTQVLTTELKSAMSEGLGGSNSLRGVLRNRVVGDGYFMGNVEARWKFARFDIGNNKFYLGLNGFLDFGQVTKKIEVETQVSSISDYSMFFQSDAEKMHYSYGAGLRVVMNENFVVKLDYGIAANEHDGTSGMYIGLNYLF